MYAFCNYVIQSSSNSPILKYMETHRRNMFVFNLIIISLSFSGLQMTLKKHGFELLWSTYMHFVYCFFFLRNIKIIVGDFITPSFEFYESSR